MVRVSHLLESWLERQAEPLGSVLCGEAGVRLRRNPDTTVGIDVVYVSPELAAMQSGETTLVEGVPVLVVEILSPNDTQEQIDEKVDGYLQAGVRLVWVIDPHDRTVLIDLPTGRGAGTGQRASGIVRRSRVARLSRTGRATVHVNAASLVTRKKAAA
jgi:Uma2 family endonuclease